MCSELKLLDTVPLQNKSAINIGIIPSDDSQYCILVEDGIYVFKLCGLMDNFLKTMSFMKWFIKPGDFALSSHLGIDINSFITSLPQFDMYEAVLRLDLSEELKEALPLKQQPVQAKWSSLGLVSNNNCVLAAMSNTGALRVYAFTTNESEIEEFIEVCNVTEICVRYFSVKFFPTIFRGATYSSLFEELKKRAGIATPSAFTWTHLISKDDEVFTFLMVGHYDGGVTVCRIKQMKNNETFCDCRVVGYFQTHLKKPTFMHWQQANDDGLLIVGDLEGRIKAISVTQISQESVKFENEIFLWGESDGLRTDCLKVVVHDKNIYVLAVKGSVLVITLIDESGRVADVYPFHVGDFIITGVEHYEGNTILVLTYTGVLKEVMLFNEENKIKIKWRHLFIDYKWWSHRTHGLIVSQNRVFIGVLVSMSKLTNIKKRKDHVRLLVFMNVAKKPLQVLLNNESNTLTSYWDCLEVLRLNGLLDRKLSNEGLSPELDYDKMSLVQLKMCLALAKSSEVMVRNSPVMQTTPTLKSDEFKYILKIRLAMDHMYRLLDQLANGGQLSVFHMQSLDLLNAFLKETVAKGMILRLLLGKLTLDGLYDIIATASELKYPDPPVCVWCEEKIIGLSCVPAHSDTRCCISFMPVTHLPYYKCKFCKSTVHVKLTDVYKTMLCPYCDIPLSYVGRLILKDQDSHPVEISVDLRKANCKSDCVEESVNVDEVEHAFTYLDTNELLDIIQISDDDNSN
ncbi:uncharacterized protein LOC116172967 [Photinus pyralis]|uniref:uncharacterized protein LOC116172967 n=1 Tax=Photinus pyralis TaxID=7054 RepID=UPI001267076A|nr:uncharacterized protein LOC116172967 [Photinus pyralis]